MTRENHSRDKNAPTIGNLLVISNTAEALDRSLSEITYGAKWNTPPRLYIKLAPTADGTLMAIVQANCSLVYPCSQCKKPHCIGCSEQCVVVEDGHHGGRVYQILCIGCFGMDSIWQAVDSEYTEARARVLARPSGKML